MAFKQGIVKGDCVTIYMPLVPEAVVAMLACAMIGAPHCVIFGGFSSQAILDRVEDAQSRYILTADGGFRRGQVVPLKANVDEALTRTSLVKKVIVLKHVINVSGHRLGTAEIESALVAHEAVAEAAVVPIPHEIKGTGIAAFVTLERGRKATPELKQELINWVGKQIGGIAKPDVIRFTESLPKTRSGKIMRRLLKELAASGEIKGDVTTLEDFAVIARLKQTDEG